MTTTMNANQSAFSVSPSLGNCSLWNSSSATPAYCDYAYDYDDPQPKPTSSALHVAFALVRYVFPVIILVGTTGNAVSAAVMLRRRMRATSIYCYLQLLAVVDTAVLYISALKTWIRLVAGVEWLHLSTASCRTLMFLFLVTIHLSAWLIVVVSADRFVAVWMPLRALTLCTPRRAWIICVVMTCVIVVANLHVFWTIHLIRRRTHISSRLNCFI